MKILHIINDLGSGGAEKLLTDILPRMKQQGHEIHLLILNRQNNVEHFVQKIENEGIKIIALGDVFFNPMYFFKIIPILKNGNFDIVHVHLFPSLYYISIASLFSPKKTRLFYTEHNVTNNRRNYISLKFADRWIYKKYHKVICITQLVKKSLDEWLNQSDKTIVINNGVNLEEIAEAQKNINKQDYVFLDKRKNNLLMVGRFNLSQKNQLSLVEAIAMLNDDYQLYFAGVGADEEVVQKKCDELEISHRVSFLGFREDVYKLMCLVDLNILSTHHEGLSGVALEGLASGKPFIGSNVEGVYDVMPNEKFLFPDNDPETLAVKIKNVLNNKDEADYLVETGTDFVQQFSIDKMATSYLKAYEIEMSKNH